VYFGLNGYYEKLLI